MNDSTIKQNATHLFENWRLKIPWKLKIDN